MVRIDQTIFGKKGNCYSACIASILEIPIMDVPTFSYGNGKSSFINASEWLTKYFNMYLVSFQAEVENSFNKENLKILRKLDVYHLTLGPARLYDTYHCCVGLRGVVVHDPNPQRLGLDKIQRYELLVPIKLK